MVQISVDRESIEAFCNRWKIARFALFGSVLHETFRPDSDVDVLVQFMPEAKYGLFDMVHMEKELKDIFGREVDLVEWTEIENSRNYIRRRAILGSAETIYAAR